MEKISRFLLNAGPEKRLHFILRQMANVSDKPSPFTNKQTILSTRAILSKLFAKPSVVHLSADNRCWS